MKSLMTLTGILAFSFSNITYGTSFNCAPSTDQEVLECSGTVTVLNQAQLDSYRNDLGVKKGKIKNLNIAFSPSLTTDLNIATPCSIKIADNITLSSSANICLHGTAGVNVGENFKFIGKDLILESRDEVIVKINSELTGQNLKLLSNGSGDTSKAHLRDGTKVNAANLLIESHDRGSIGQNSNVTLTGTLGIYTLGDDEASIRVGSTISALKVEVSSTEETRIAKNTSISASEVIFNGAVCKIDKTAVINASDKLGNCFLGSIGKAGFIIDKNQGNNPLTVNFNTTGLTDAKGFIWSFGDGETLNTTSATVSHTYTRVGSYTAILKYATKDNYKGLKNGGFVQIDVKSPPVVVQSTPPRGNFSYAQDGTFVYLKAFIRKTQFDIANAYYVIDDNQNNKIQITNFYQNSQASVEMNTFGTHKVTMYVEDVQGQKYNTTMMIDLKQNEEQISPIVRFYGEQSAPRTAFINMASSFIPYPDEFLKDFRVEFGDGQVAEVHDAVSVVHTYAAAGTYNVKVTAEFNGIERFLVVPVTVTNDNKSALSPVAAFDYHLFDFAGNVTFNDDRSATPNGEIISYVWNFGDGSQAYGKLASHFFAPGNHLVSLTVTDTMGLTSTQRQMISIPEPGDDIVSNLSCWEDGDKKLSCDVFALDKFDEITRVRVQWGDGVSVNLTGQAEIEEWGLYFAEHVYQNYGTYNLRLTVDTARGQTKYAYQSVEFENSDDESSINASIFCSITYMTVSCNSNGTNTTQGTIVLYSFDFGDGQFQNSLNGVVNYRYSVPGQYTIKLLVKNSLGKIQQVQTMVSAVASAPVGSISCINNFLNIHCNGLNSFDPSQSLLNYEFDMGDGTVINSTTGLVSHTYAVAGVYLVRLRVKNQEGMENEVQGFYQVLSPVSNLPPILAISCESYTPFSIECDLRNSYDIDGRIVKYSMNFEGTFSTQGSSTFTHLYSSGGVKSIVVRIEDDMGSVTEEVINYTVKDNFPPVAAFECLSTPLTLNCLSYSTEQDWDNIILYEWDMGDGYKTSSLVNSNVSHRYVASGTYKITLKVTDQYGASSYIEKNVEVKENLSPVVSINCISTFGDQVENTYYCNGDASDLDGYIVERFIRINGIKFPWVSSLEYEFMNGGENIVEHYAKDNLGNETSVFTTVNITNKPIISFSCQESRPYHVKCEAQDLPGALSYSYFIDNLKVLHGKEVEFDLETSGTVRIKLQILTSSLEVSRELGIEVQYNYLTPKPSFISYVDMNRKVVFDATKSYLQDRKVKTFIWNFGDGNVQRTSSEKIEHYFSGNNNYQVSLSVEDMNGNLESDSQSVYVYDPEVDMPDEEDNSTLFGVDSDNDFVRDDIQRWIAYEAKGDTVLQYNLKKLSKVYQIQFLNSENRDTIMIEEEKKQNAKACILGNATDDNLGYYYIDMIDYLYSSTKERSFLKAQINSNVWGNVMEIPNTRMQRLEKCSGN